MKKQEEKAETAETPKMGLFDALNLDKPIGSAAPTAQASADGMLANMSPAQLINLRARIEEMLPARKLSEINLEQEIVFQFQAAQSLMVSVHDDDITPANQKAQVANSCASVLDQLLKMQTRIFNAERIKAIEQAIIKVVKTLPSEAQKQFFADYERIYSGVET